MFEFIGLCSMAALVIGVAFELYQGPLASRGVNHWDHRPRKPKGQPATYGCEVIEASSDGVGGL